MTLDSIIASRDYSTPVSLRLIQRMITIHQLLEMPNALKTFALYVGPKQFHFLSLLQIRSVQAGTEQYSTLTATLWLKNVSSDAFR